MAYRTFKRAARNWEEFASAKKVTVQRGLTYQQAQDSCREYNDNRTHAQIRRGTKMEFDQE